MANDNQSGSAAAQLVPKKKIGEILNKYGIYFILLALIAGMGLATKGDFIQVKSLTNIILQSSFVGLIAVGVTVIIITTGIDLSSGSVFAMSAVVAASLSHPALDAAGQELAKGQYPMIVAILAGLTVAMMAGLINGILIARFELPPFIVTLGMMTAARGVALLYTNGKPIGGFNDYYNALGQSRIVELFMHGATRAINMPQKEKLPFDLPIPIILLILFTIFTYIILNKTRFGRHIYAVGGNEQAAIISGVNVRKIKIIVYTYASMLAGLAGMASSSRIESANPGSGVSYELDAIAGAVIGGTSQSTGGIGTVQGTIVGVLIIFIINSGMNMMNINSYWQQIVKAIIIVGAVLLDKKRNKI
jgi:inositol transport system permease protein